MSAAKPSSKRAGLARAAGMLFRPGETWRSIADEPTEVRSLYLAYVAPLAALGPFCGAVGLQVFGASIAGIHLKPALGETLIGAAVAYGLTLVAVWLLALAVSALAPAFGGRADRREAAKLVAYSATAFWIAGLFALYPTLGFPLAVLGGLYSLYALRLGLAPVMRAPVERTLTYFAAVLVCVLALGLGLRLAAGQIG